MGILADKVGIVTGAGRGIGRAEVLAIAAEGAALVVNSRSSRAETVAREAQELGARAVAHVADVADWNTGDALVELAVATFGRLDFVVNNAGIIKNGPIAESSEADWVEALQTNLVGTASVCRAAAGHWMKRHAADGAFTGARIVNTASQAGIFGRKDRTCYAASKAAITGLTRALAQELLPFGVTCNEVSPRARTSMNDGRFGSFDDGGAGSVDASGDDGGLDPWSPEYIGPVVAWLCSDRAARITGRTIVAFNTSVWVMADPSTEVRMRGAGPRWTGRDVADLADRELSGVDFSTPTGPWTGAELMQLAAQR